MKSKTGMLAAGAFGLALLVGMIAAGYAGKQTAAQPSVRETVGTPPTEARAVERRRGRIAEAAIADTTTQ